jgi:hypothetical protein
VNTYSTTVMRLADHREALAKLWADNMGDPRIAGKLAERIVWLYEKNPSGPARTWLGLSPAPTSQIIGCGSLFPRAMWVGGEMVQGGVLADFAVDKHHRLAGPAITIQRAIVKGSRESGFDFVFGWPNAKSVAVVKRVGYTPIGTTSSWVKPLRTEKKLAELLAEKAAARPRFARLAPAAPLLAKVGAPILDRALWANDWRMLAPSLRELRSAVVDRADRRFDELWQRGRENMPFIAGEKTADYLNWRYADFTTARYRFFTLSERSTDRLVGYVAYYVRNDAAFVADLYCDDLSRVDPLLAGCAIAARREKVRSLSLTYIGTDRFTSRLRRLGFFDRGGERPLIVYLDPQARDDLRQAVLDPQRWFMFDGELDI